MVSSTYTQYQDLFQAGFAFTRQLSQSPGLYCRLEVKLGDNSINCQTRSPGRCPARFPGKRKISSNYRKGTLLVRGCLLLVTMELGLLHLGTLHEQIMEYFPLPHLLLRVVELILVRAFILFFHKFTSVGWS